MMSILVGFVLLSVIYEGIDANNPFVAGGPYTINVKRIDKCRNQGTGEVEFNTKISKKSPKEYILNANWTWPYDVDEFMKTKILSYKWSPPSGWMQTVFTYETSNMCKELDQLFPKMWTSLSEAQDEENPCPLKAGKYHVEDWVLNLNLPAENLMYGQYMVLFKFIKDNANTIGCMAMFGEVVPL
ncbi:uncharacterized protein [Anabrus simplex]|uniref:uncharacterized protein n=1 Tax=Anabrus simplex TaxID=316456 RepID=UPI0034DD7CDA